MNLKVFYFTLCATSVLLVASEVYGQAQTAPNSAAPQFWWVGVASALIGAISALLTPVVKDLFIQRANERRAKSISQHEIFRNYAAPLAAASEKLLWRFAEIFIEKRHHFLKSATLPLVYNEYKRTSTLYRIACLLGWIRAIHLELSALPRGASGFLTPVSGAIAKVQSALADGPHVEIHRLERMCEIWDLSLKELDENGKRVLATEFEVKLYGLGGDALRHDTKSLEGLDQEKKFEICRALSHYLCQETRRAKISDEIINETLGRAVAGLSYREALIYRDWQDAIGDTMLEPDPDSVRRFKLIGYERFEGVLSGNFLWMEVFRDSIIDIDFDFIDPSDFRAKQLRDLAAGVSGIILSLRGTEEGDLVQSPVLDVANKLANARG
jgi:hypothetical protein